MLNNKKRFKKAFSLVEVATVMVFAGVILIYELVILNGKINNYNSAYYNAYNTLSLLTYNVFADPECVNAVNDNSELGKKCYGNNYGNEKRGFPINGIDLCYRFSEFLNIPKSGLHCGGGDEDADEEKQDGVSKFTVNESADNIGKATRRFTTSNSNRFYIDDRLYEYKGDEEKFRYPDGSDAKLEYFIVYIDINGSKGPNKVKTEANGKYLPDIVPFAVTRRGEVIPMGYPIYSQTYMSARVETEDVNENSTTNEDGTTSTNNDQKKFVSDSMTYYEAIHRAYGNDKKDNAVCESKNKEDIEENNIYFDNKYTYQLCGTLNNNKTDKNSGKVGPKNNLALNIPENVIGNIKTLPIYKKTNGDNFNCYSNNMNCKVIIEKNADTRVNFSF